MSRDRIELRGLRLLVRVGVLPIEQTQDQPIEVDIDLLVDLTAAGTSDDLADTIDYGQVCAVLEQAASTPAALLERLAGRLADSVLGYDDRITTVDLVVRKLRPPVPQQLATAGVRVVRSRDAG